MTPYLEIGGDYREVVPGTFLLELPLPFSLGLINVYLVRLNSGYMLIDCGMETEACLQALTRALEGLEIGWTDIRQILLTHIHPDHMGLTPKIAALSGASLHLHGADEELLAEITDRERHESWQRDVLKAAGVPLQTAALVEGSMHEVQQSFHRLTPERRLCGGEVYPTRDGALEVHWTPGHSPGHVCLYDRARRVLISGDHILEHISPNIGWQPGRDALGEFLASLERIAELEVDLILPSHGSPFTGHREWVRKTREHHAERCERILTLIDSGAGTADDIARQLWNRPLSPFHYRFAIFEVLAHLEYLERRAAVRSDRSSGVYYWTRAAG